MEFSLHNWAESAFPVLDDAAQGQALESKFDFSQIER